MRIHISIFAKTINRTSSPILSFSHTILVNNIWQHHKPPPSISGLPPFACYQHSAALLTQNKLFLFGGVRNEINPRMYSSEIVVFSDIGKVVGSISIAIYLFGYNEGNLTLLSLLSRIYQDSYISKERDTTNINKASNSVGSGSDTHYDNDNNSLLPKQQQQLQQQPPIDISDFFSDQNTTEASTIKERYQNYISPLIHHSIVRHSLITTTPFVCMLYLDWMDYV